jgi:hypothetical protein
MNTQEKNDKQAKPVKRHMPGITVTTGVRVGEGLPPAIYNTWCVKCRADDDCIRANPECR